MEPDKNFQPTQIDNWSKSLGLLPVHLFPSNSNSKDQFILMNGSNGNFCLDTNPETDVDRARDYAWSSNSGHFVDLLNDYVYLHRWDTSIPAEKIPLHYISENIDKFYLYLLGSQPKPENSIVNYAIRVFRKLKYSLRNNLEQGKTINAFLVLLASVIDNSTISNLNKKIWGLKDEDLTLAELIPNLDWSALHEELTSGIKLYKLKPDLSLLIRHASGKLFQEAHYESLFLNPYQLSFDGMLIEASPSKINNSSIGVFYTPSSIVRSIVEESFYFYNVDSKNSLTIFDPACGSGEFLREALRQLKVKNYLGKVKIIGWDLSPIAIDITRFVLTYEKRDWLNSNLEIELKHQDSLEVETSWPKDIDIILMNPPFLSWENMNVEQRNLVKATLDNLIEKKPDYSSAFIYKASKNISANGILATIIPASFLSGESNQKIRNELKVKFTTLLIGRLGSQLLFTDALIDSAIFIAQNIIKEDVAPTALWADVNPNSSSEALRTLRKLRLFNDEDTVINKEHFSIYKDNLISNLNNWTPRSYTSFKLIDKLKNYSKVKDVFNIKQGIRTGYNPAFIVEKNYYEGLPKKERNYFRPCVINRSIENGQLKDDYFVFYPHGKKLLKINSEDDLKKYLRNYYKDKLLPNKEILVKRARKNITNWWTLSEYRAWQLDKIPKIVSAYFGGSGSFAFDETGDFAIVQGFGWMTTNMKPNISYAYLAILHSSIINELLSTVANQVAGGQYELSKRYISEMPLPNLIDLYDNLSSTINELSKIGQKIASAERVDKVQLDRIVESFFDVK